MESYGSGIRVSSGPARAYFEPLEPLDRVEIFRGGNPSQGGWISRKFGQKLPITTVLWHSDITGVTVLQARIRYTRSRTGAS